MDTSSISKVSSASSASSVSSASTKSNQLAGSTDEFLQIFIAQLKNQDPTDPVDSKDMVTSIGQLNQVSFLSEIKDDLASLASKDNTSVSDLVMMYGKTVEYVDDEEVYTESGISGSIHSGTSDSVNFYDSTGKKVGQAVVDENGEFSWQGGQEGQEYTMVAMKDGKVSGAALSFSGVVVDVDINNKQMYLDNNDNITLDKVTSVKGD